MTWKGKRNCRLCGNEAKEILKGAWIPACAGMTDRRIRYVTEEGPIASFGKNGALYQTPLD